MSESFGKWLLAARKKARLSQEALAEKAGISKSYVGTLENERPHTITGAIPQPDKKKVMQIAKALRVSENEALLAAGYAATENESDDTAALLRDINQVPPERRAMAIKIARGAVEPLKENPDFDFDYIED